MDTGQGHHVGRNIGWWSWANGCECWHTWCVAYYKLLGDLGDMALKGDRDVHSILCSTYRNCWLFALCHLCQSHMNWWSSLWCCILQDHLHADNSQLFDFSTRFSPVCLPQVSLFPVVCCLVLLMCSSNKLLPLCPQFLMSACHFLCGLCLLWCYHWINNVSENSELDGTLSHHSWLLLSASFAGSLLARLGNTWSSWLMNNDQ